MGGALQGVISLEPVYGDSGGSRPVGRVVLRSMFEEPASHSPTRSRAGKLIHLGQYGEGVNIQIPLMANRFRKGEIRVETLTRSGEWFRENFPVTPPTAVTALTDYREKDRKTVWYNSRYYRTNLLWEGGTLCIRDIHMFDQRMESDYYRKAGTTNQWRLHDAARRGRLHVEHPGAAGRAAGHAAHCRRKPWPQRRAAPPP